MFLCWFFKRRQGRRGPFTRGPGKPAQQVPETEGQKERKPQNILVLRIPLSARLIRT